jgi:hypothetical protein
MIETDSEGYGLYCSNCHCDNCESARIEEAWEDALYEHSRRFPVYGPITQDVFLMQELYRSMFENMVVDPCCAPGVATS